MNCVVQIEKLSSEQEIYTTTVLNCATGYKRRY
jgi:hypothetical protein